MSSDAVRLRAVTKQFPASARRGWRLALPGVTASLRDERALAGIDLTVARGEALGLIGPNGAGKSTLLKIVAGVIAPTSGSVWRYGRIGAMIELGLGFHPDLTGRENLLCAASLLGLDGHSARRRVGQIAEFAGLVDVLDAPLSAYSTGMAARLGFATATHVDADVLAVDEVLSVGDTEFQERCLQRMRDLVAAGTTLLFVSHEMPLVAAVCDRVVLLREGQVADVGDPPAVVEGYLGRRTPRRDPDDDVARISGLQLASDRIDPFGRLAFTAELEVRRPERVRRLRAVLTLPTTAPDFILGETSVDLRARGISAGRFALSARSEPMPMTGGFCRVTLLVTSDTDTALAEQSCDFVMEGPLHLRRPMYAGDPHITLVRVTTTDPAERSDQEPSHDTHVPSVGAPAADDTVAIRATEVTKRFPIGRRERLLSSVPGRSRAPSRSFTALDGADLVVRRGESVGLIGPNGAGKSTLLRCIAGIHAWDGGTIETVGRVVPLLELGLGFRPDFDGWDNVAIMASMLGMDRRSDAVEAALEFSGVREHLDQPVKHLSSGMRARLGFALAVHARPDILLIDEVLAVGDQEFRRRALGRIGALQRDGVAIVVVSHDLSLVAQACDRVARIEEGRVIDDGAALEIVERYGGTHDAGHVVYTTSPVHLRPLEVAPGPRRGERIVTTTVEVTEPAPHVRLAFGLRADGWREHEGVWDLDGIEAYAAAGWDAGEMGALSQPGTYRFRSRLDPIAGLGSLHLVLSAIDAVDAEILSETWTSAALGTRTGDYDEPAMLAFDLDFDLRAI